MAGITSQLGTTSSQPGPFQTGHVGTNGTAAITAGVIVTGTLTTTPVVPPVIERPTSGRPLDGRRGDTGGYLIPPEPWDGLLERLQESKRRKHRRKQEEMLLLLLEG